MRYIIVPEKIQLLDPMTDEKIADGVWTFEKFIRGLFCHPQAFQMFDVNTLFDLKERLRKPEAGQVIQLDDTPWNALVALTKNPMAINAWMVFQMKPFVVAILEASSEQPQKKTYAAIQLEGTLQKIA